MRKIDAFAHILPTGYLQHLERHLASTMRPAQLRYYQEGVFRFDPVTDTPLGAPHAIDDTMADLGAAGLSAAELAAVYAGNAQRLLGVR